MLARAFRCILLFLVAPGMLFWSYSPANSRPQAVTDGSYPGADSPTDVIGILFTQPIDPIGKLLQSSWLDPDGSDNDRYVWDNFTLPTTETITEIDWVGGYEATLEALVMFGGFVASSTLTWVT